jgi:hypothetical protein
MEGPEPGERDLAQRRASRWVVAVTVVAASATVGVTVWAIARNLPQGQGGTVVTVASTVPRPTYPLGTPSAAEPSGYAPPGAGALPGFHRVYLDDFNSPGMPPGWDVFTGVPGGDPGGHFGRDHVKVAAGLLQLNTYRDPAFGNQWVTAGMCQCGFPRVYGAYFIRSRITGGGANQVQLLWPESNQWPPEIDFNESGGYVAVTSWTFHFSALNHLIQERLDINMLVWHTWGLIWTSRGLTFTVDGRVWGRVAEPAIMPSVPLRLDLEQRALCSMHAQCPRRAVSMDVDWIEEYSPNA